MIIALNDSDDVEEPEAKCEDEDEEEDESAEHEDAREGGFRETVKTRPKTQQQEKQFKRERDEKSFAFGQTRHRRGLGGVGE